MKKPVPGPIYQIPFLRVDILKQGAENIEQVLWLHDLNSGQILYVSPAFETIWGRSCESLYANPVKADDGAGIYMREHGLSLGGDKGNVHLQAKRPGFMIQDLSSNPNRQRLPQFQNPSPASTANSEMNCSTEKYSTLWRRLTY